MSTGTFIIGNRNTVSEDASGVVLINASGETITSEHNGQTRINNGSLIVNDVGYTKGLYAPYQETLTSPTTLVQYNRPGSVFFIDATSNNIDITIEHTLAMRVFIRTDNTANTVTLIPDSGLINGAASYGLNVQYEKITVISDQTDFYY